MTPEDIRLQIYQARDSWVKGDGKAFADLFVPDGEFIVPGNRWVGQDAIQKTVNEFASGHTGVEIRIQRILTDGNSALVEWNWKDVEKIQARNLKRKTRSSLILEAVRLADGENILTGSHSTQSRNEILLHLGFE